VPDWTRLAPGLSRRQRWFYQGWETLARWTMIVLYRWRAYDRHNVPRQGPLLVVANHQSYLDSTCVGCGLTPWVAVHVARSGLYKGRLVDWFLRNLNTIPIRSESGEGDTAAMKEIIRRLGEGNCVIIFPEGSRTHDGRMGEFKPGVALIIKRAKCAVLPAAIEGCFDAWPRTRTRPRLFGQRIAVKYGKAIPAEELLKDGARESLHRLEREIDRMRLELRGELRRRTGGRFPPAGPGDSPSFGEPAVAPIPVAAAGGAGSEAAHGPD
jgi:1-acyl-sn-glycerol-3-phosphate acyltransferase